MEKTFTVNYPEGVEVSDEIRSLIETTLEEHTQFVSDGFANHIDPKDLNDVITERNKQNEIANSKAKEFKKQVLANTKLDPKAYEDAIKLTDFNDDDDDTARLEKVKATVEKKSYLQINTNLGIEGEQPKPKPKEEPKKKKRFFVK